MRILPMMISYQNGRLKIITLRNGQNLQKKCGAKYIFITSKHHDGFCLWPSKYTDRNAMQMGPKKDLLGQFFEAGRKEGLKVGLYYSLYEWFNPLYTNKEIPYAGLKKVNNYVDDYMIPQIKELIDLYHPDFFYFDGEMGSSGIFLEDERGRGLFLQSGCKKETGGICQRSFWQG